MTVNQALRRLWQGNYKPAWATYRIPDQLGLGTLTLHQEKKNVLVVLSGQALLMKSHSLQRQILHEISQDP